MQDGPVPCVEGSVHFNSDDVCTQAYGHEDGATNYPNKGQGIAVNSDDVCTQAYGHEGATNYPNKGEGIPTNSDDVCTQAYGDESGATNYPNKGQRIPTNSDDVCTQAYGHEGATNYPNKGQGIATNSDDVCTQAYGDEEGTTNYPNKGQRIPTNSDDVCTQAYTEEESAIVRSSPRKRPGRKRTVSSKFFLANIPDPSSIFLCTNKFFFSCLTLSKIILIVEYVVLPEQILELQVYKPKHHYSTFSMSCKYQYCVSMD